MTYGADIAETLRMFREMGRENLGGTEDVVHAARVGTLYIMHAERTDLYKIGRTSGSVHQRRQQLQAGCPFQLTVVADFAAKNVESLEKKVHAALAGCSVRGEWFRLSSKALRDVKDVLIPRLLEESR